MKKKLLGQKRVVKNYTFEVKSVDLQNHIIEGVFSTPVEDRHGEIVKQEGWLLDEYMTNPVVLWSHKNEELPIAQMTKLSVDGNGNLSGAMKFAVDEYEFADTVFNLMQGKYLRAFSVGFMNSRYEIDQENDIVILLENSLLEVSVVNVPANQLALAKSKGIDIKGLEDEMEKGAIPYADHDMADEGIAWDGPGEMKACGDDMGKLKSICAWFDSENPDVKSSYKLPHHQADGLKAVWKGVAAAMGALLGARGGANIPESDRQAVYNHLAKHYKAFGKEVPEFKAMTEVEEAMYVLSESNKETIRAAIKTLSGVLEATEADNQVGQKGRTPPNRGGNKITVKNLNQAIRELLGVKRETKKFKIKRF